MTVFHAFESVILCFIRRLGMRVEYNFKGGRKQCVERDKMTHLDFTKRTNIMKCESVDEQMQGKTRLLLELLRIMEGYHHNERWTTKRILESIGTISNKKDPLIVFTNQQFN